MWQVRRYRGVGFALVALALMNCSRAVRLKVVLKLPGSALDIARLHLSSAKSCPPGALSMPIASAGKTESERDQAATSAGGFTVESTFHGGQCLLALGVWYDSNGNGSVDAGDYTGATLPILVVDRGLCQGNEVEAPELTLLRVP